MLATIKKQITLGFVSLFLIYFVQVSAVFANESMIIAVHDYAPIYNKKGKGLMSEVYIEAGKAVGIDVKIKVYPVRRGIHQLITNEVDGFSPGQAFMSPDQIEKTSMIPTVFNAVVGFAYYDPGRKKNVVFNSLDDFKGKKLATIIGSPLIPLLKKHGLTWEEKNSATTHLRMLKAGRIDFAEMSLLATLFNTKQLFKEKMSEFNYVKFVAVPCSVAFNNSNPRTKTLKPKFAKGIEIVKKNGEYIRIFESYWGKGNIQKDALPKDMVKFGVEKSDFDVFNKYKREPWGKILN